MAFTLPQWVNSFNLWRAPNASPDPPDQVDVECQFYVTPKGQWPFVDADGNLVFPPIYLRVPKGTDLQVDDVVEVNAASGHFYTVRWVERVHLDFPNEYLVGILEQGVSTPSAGAGSILLETGEHVLIETGDLMIEE